ncbi:protein FRA10AC1 [Drosophila grimshawi]|uniref:GH10621 n=1 Tax=Drosophila grimshawi TaxID=7222 RepID=B4JCW5_DROGR|nr:protein FRA10AC1 [Drosophila grimshawi]EDW03204.1 GH10621 [Drosophila grimshawi]
MSSKTLFPINLDKLTAKERHNYILNQYVLPTAAEGESRKHKRDIDVIRENHRFLWDEEDADLAAFSWEQRLALRYYRKLFKEYCIADLSRYKENKIALRWRTKQEVVDGLGQFQCGSRHCGERDGLRSWEVNFKYLEHGTPLNALVKVRLCPVHTDQLNYHTKKKEHKRQRRREKDERKAKKKHKRRKLDATNQETDEVNEPEMAQQEDADPVASDDATGDKASDPTDDQIWSKQLDISKDQPSREQEFERYLEDLLL